MSTLRGRMADRRRAHRHDRAVRRALSVIHSRAVRDELLSMLDR